MEEIGFGLAQRDKRNAGNMGVGGSEGRKAERLERKQDAWMGSWREGRMDEMDEWEGGVRRDKWRDDTGELRTDTGRNYHFVRDS